ncbi:MAG: hypothetical protein ACREV1_04835 [Gammaproteobacteria bacterium]
MSRADGWRFVPLLGRHLRNEAFRIEFAQLVVSDAARQHRHVVDIGHAVDELVAGILGPAEVVAVGVVIVISERQSHGGVLDAKGA